MVGWDGERAVPTLPQLLWVENVLARHSGSLVPVVGEESLIQRTTVGVLAFLASAQSPHAEWVVVRQRMETLLRWLHDGQQLHPMTVIVAS